MLYCFILFCCEFLVVGVVVGVVGVVVGVLFWVNVWLVRNGSVRV